MEDLRWILLLVGGLVVAAVYFSSRFEREDWVREREKLDARNRSLNKARNRSHNTSQIRSQLSVPKQAPVEGEVVSEVSPSFDVKSRKEPQMSSLDVVAENVSAPDFSVAKEITAENPASTFSFGASSEMDSEIDSGETPGSVECVTEPHSSFSFSDDLEGEELDETNVSEAITTSSFSEIPADVSLTEQSVSTLTETISASQSRDDDLQAEAKVEHLSIDAGIEDEITGVDIPFELATAEAEIEIENHRRDTRESTAPQVEQGVNIEPLVLVITVMAEDENFSGPAVREALEAEGLQHGEMRIFHYFDHGASNASDSEDSENIFPVFSVASLVEPGYFELEKIHEMEMPGLTLFCQLPGSLPGEKAFEIMLDKGRGLAVRLHGQMCDDKHNRFTTQAKTHYQDRIATFSRKLTVAKKKAGNC
jgi:cell division protein ZipA